MRLLLLLGCTLILGACASLSPRFPTSIATGFARDEMWKLTTPESEIYYPKQHEAEALRIAQQMRQCLLTLRSKTLGNTPTKRMLVFLTSANLNNAYVSGEYGGVPLHTVNPLFLTSETFHWYNMSGGDVSEVVCHEIFHYVHFEQTRGIWRWFNLIFGPQVSPQASLERWFTEGVAQFYEGRLKHPAGRPHSPYYYALFHSGIAARKGKLYESDLHPQTRELLPASGAYLTSLFFVEYLAETYGEEKLWELISLQADAFFFPFGVSLRFQKTYGKPLASLLEDWEAHLNSKITPPPPPPASQTTLMENVGYVARLGVAADGSMAVAFSHREKTSALLLLENDGRLRAKLSLTQYVPYRQWTSASASGISGLSFSRDGRWLFLHNNDINSWGNEVGQLWKVDAYTAQVVQVWQDAGSLGGCLHPDGQRYLWVELQPGKTRLVEFHLLTQQKKTLLEEGPGVGYAAPSYSPDGKYIAFSRWEGKGWDIHLCRIGGECKQLTHDAAFNYAPKWLDKDNLLFTRQEGNTAQAFRLHLPSQKYIRLTQAPFFAMDASPSLSHVTFLNRVGWDWSLARIPFTLHDEALENGTSTNETLANAAQTPQNEKPQLGALTIESNHPYSGWEELWLPKARIPFVDIYIPAKFWEAGVGSSFGVSLYGSDRLSFHNWAVDFRFAAPYKAYSAALAYLNQQLAPWTVFAQLQYDKTPFVQYWAGQLGGQRSFFATPLRFSFLAIDKNRLGHHQRYLGPSLSAHYAAGTSTAMGGIQSLFQIGAAGSFFLRGVGSTRNVVDFSGHADFGIPLPFSTRHSFMLSLKGRSLPNAPKGTLQLGGMSYNPVLFQSQDFHYASSPSTFLPMFFGEALRGFEDFSIRANHAGIANARYRYSFVIDRGSASTFKIFPSLFWRQVDVELFGTTACSDNPTQRWLHAAGLAVFLRTSIAQSVSLSLYYQLSIRMAAQLPPLHLIGYSLE
ncbi:MAG: hypothetical protein FWC28_04220 [Proteobacteria bacterium]|nr:hypothetical protein [Cystobacterineae bacterium]MCL2314443.1 hypothetical protein [Pseudomonadota bacterium]